MSEPESRVDKTQVRVSGKSARSTQSIPGRYQASIVIIKGYAEGMEYPLTKAYTVLGRDESADIPLRDALVSRQHVAIEFMHGEFLLRDLDSTNGTALNGKMVREARVRNRDRFQVGDTTIQFIVEDAGAGKVFEIR